MCRGSRVAAARSKWASEARQSRPEQLRSRGPSRWHTETRAPEGTIAVGVGGECESTGRELGVGAEGGHPGAEAR